MKIFKYITYVICFTILLTSCKQHTSQKRIGIILPLEHAAMKEITDGFTETLTAAYHQPISIKIENAQNDPNLQRAIIQQMRDNHYDLIIPVGTSASQMSIAMIHDKPIIALAADMTESQRQQLKSCHVAVVHDEISPNDIIQLLHQLYPGITHITLIHSSADKVLPEVKAIIAAGKTYHIIIETRMAASLPELTQVAQAISPQTQAILILKDSLIVSGISTLANIAKQRHLPLMTSDQGSVEDGGGFALGVHEKQIGREGAKLAAAILNGQAACNLPITEMDKLTVFINPTALAQAQQDAAHLIETAQRHGYNIEQTGSL